MSIDKYIDIPISKAQTYHKIKSFDVAFETFHTMKHKPLIKQMIASSHNVICTFSAAFAIQPFVT